MNTNPTIFATGSYDCTIKLWDPSSGTCYKTMKHKDSQVNCMAIHPQRCYLAAGGYERVSLYDITNDTDVPISNLEGIFKNTNAIGFQDKGAWMYTAGEDKTIKLWTMKSRNIQCVGMIEAKQPINCVALHPNQVDFFIGDENGNLLRWDIRTRALENLIEPKSPIRSITINNEGSILAYVNNDGVCTIFSVNGGFNIENSPQLANRSEFLAHKRYGLKCLFSPDSTLIATSSADGTAKIWRTINFSLAKECKETNNRWIWDLAFSYDSKHLFTASSDKLARLWSVETGEVIRDYEGHSKHVVCLAFSDSRI